MGSSRHRRDRVRGERECARGARRDGSGRPRDGRLPALAVGLVAAALLAGCGGERPVAAAPPAEPAVDFTAIDSPGLQFLPRQEEAPGWRLEKDPLVVPGNRIETWLGADGPNFARYEVVDVTAGEYVATDGAGFATVEIFRFPDFVQAFGAYSTRKDVARRFVPLENEAYVTKYSVHLWRGPFYVRVTGGADDAFEALTRLASSVAEHMPTAPARPAVFDFFPSEGRVPNSERYSVERGFGQTFLANSFQVSFVANGDAVDGLIIPSASRTAAATILDAYRALYVRNGKLLDPITNLGEDNFTAEDRYLGRAVAFRLDRFVVAFHGYKDRQRLVDLAVATDARMLATVRKQLVDADRGRRAAPEPGAAARPRND